MDVGQPKLGSSRWSWFRTAPANARAPSSSDWRTVLSRIIAVGLFTGFIVYYGLLCFRPDWGGDFQMYCAGIARLYDGFLHPLHEALPVGGEQSTVYTPYLVAWAGVGKILGLSPFRVLQWAGVFNLLLLVASICFFMARSSMHRHWLLSAACLLSSMLFVHWNHYGWSSAISVTNLQYIQPFPSTFAWSLACIAFGLLGALRGPLRLASLVGLTLALTLSLSSHVLTGSWVVGVVGLYCLESSWNQRNLAPCVRAVVAVAVSLAATVAWPYSSFFGQSSMTSVREGAPFGGWPWDEFPNLYALGLACFAYLWLRHRRHAFWFWAMLATLAALGLWRFIGFDFGRRYALFAPFFAHFAIAEVLASILLLPRKKDSDDSPSHKDTGEAEGLRGRSWDQGFAWAVLLGALLSWLASPMQVRAGQRGEWGYLSTPYAILQRAAADEAYYARYDPLLPYLTPEDLVLTPVSRAVFDLASTTGASVVAAPNALRVPDRQQRARAVYTFFDRRTGGPLRHAIIRRFGVTVVLVPRSHFGLLPALTKVLGPPAYRDTVHVVYRI